MRSTLALIDYGSGNLRSAAKALERAALDADLPISIRVTADPREAAAASRIVLPGVGAFADCMAGLSAIPGMQETLARRVLQDGIPFLGICVGMQLLARTGHEFGCHAGLGWLDADVVALAPPAGSALKVPHMGWNDLSWPNTDAVRHPVLQGLGAQPCVYFVHSYVMRVHDPALVLAECDYGGPFAAIVGCNAVIGMQFHPEKSQAVGLACLTGFLRWSP
jgi:imidazole glycerol-phosphate synthase subunit HisH